LEFQQQWENAATFSGLNLGEVDHRRKVEVAEERERLCIDSEQGAPKKKKKKKSGTMCDVCAYEFVAWRNVVLCGL
jgi:hypothetical protein